MAQSTGDWVGFAATLSGMPDVVGRLLDAHRDDGRGHCLACTTPGRGTPKAVWPCGIAVVAELAAGLSAERGTRPAEGTPRLSAPHRRPEVRRPQPGCAAAQEPATGHPAQRTGR